MGPAARTARYCSGSVSRIWLMQASRARAPGYLQCSTAVPGCFILLGAAQSPLGRSWEFFGIRFVGVNPENGQKLLLTLAAIGVFLVIRWALRALVRSIVPRDKAWLAFWSGQAITLATALLLLLTILSIWFDDPTRLATALGLVTAGLAFALQKVVTAFAGYILILRGNTFSVGDRIVMGGVRGDVIALGFLQTTIMEMGQPPSVAGCGSRHLGAQPPIHAAGSSPSPTVNSSKSPSTITPATFRISGRKSRSRFPIATIVARSSRSSSTSRAATPST